MCGDWDGVSILLYVLGASGILLYLIVLSNFKGLLIKLSSYSFKSKIREVKNLNTISMIHFKHGSYNFTCSRQYKTDA